MEHFGFSYMGLLFLLALFIPNLFWTGNKPKDYDPTGESPVLLALERVGQAWVTCGALVWRDFNWRPWTAWSWWLVGAAALGIGHTGIHLQHRNELRLRKET